MAAGISRREFTWLAGGAIASAALGSACALDLSADQQQAGRLSARPKPGVKTRAEGTQRLGLGGSRDAILRVPPKAGSAPLPLLVLLHGASSSGERQLGRFGTLPDDAGLVVLAPDSRTSTWDAIQLVFGVDVEFMNQALTRVFETVNVDPNRISLGGFSDGATYALSLGLINGDFFKRIVAFSPGFVIRGGARQGKPRIFISHGTSDEILPIDRCSRVIVPQLKTAGYDVTFREFAGGHEVPSVIAAEGLMWASQR